MAVPQYPEMFNSLLDAMRELGGSGSISEIDETTGRILKLSDGDLNEMHRGNRSKLSYRLAWARNNLKRYGLLDNSSRGVWSLTPKGKETKEVDKDEVLQLLRSLDRIMVEEVPSDETEDVPEESWKEKLLSTLQELSPSGFERFCQRLLRESGFVQVQVTGRSGDGGIDGKGVIRVGGLLGFYVIFQCKRYKGSVPPKEIRDFRGAMVGRADKGLFITTGSFTRDAKAEAIRDGAPPIDLIDGDELVQKVKELGLGVEITTEELVKVDNEWFKDFN